MLRTCGSPSSWPPSFTASHPTPTFTLINVDFHVGKMVAIAYVTRLCACQGPTPFLVPTAPCPTACNHHPLSTTCSATAYRSRTPSLACPQAINCCSCHAGKQLRHPHKSTANSKGQPWSARLSPHEPKYTARFRTLHATSSCSWCLMHFKFLAAARSQPRCYPPATCREAYAHAKARHDLTTSTPARATVAVCASMRTPRLRTHAVSQSCQRTASSINMSVLLPMSLRVHCGSSSRPAPSLLTIIPLPHTPMHTQERVADGATCTFP